MDSLNLKHNVFAKELFEGIAPNYDRWAKVFSLFQYRRWHASLIDMLDPQPRERVLDVCTGTGAVAFDLAERGCDIVGLDLSQEMLSAAIRRKMSIEGGPPHGRSARTQVLFVEGRAENLPFPSAAFDVVTFTFLLRYVSDPLEPLTEMARVLRGGGRAAMLEFGIPETPALRTLWSLYVFTVLPLLTRPISPGWARVGAFLGRSIDDFYRRYPPANLFADWKHAGFQDLRCRHLSLGGAIVVAGEKR